MARENPCPSREEELRQVLLIPLGSRSQHQWLLWLEEADWGPDSERPITEVCRGMAVVQEWEHSSRPPNQRRKKAWWTYQGDKGDIRRLRRRRWIQLGQEVIHEADTRERESTTYGNRKANQATQIWVPARHLLYERCPGGMPTTWWPFSGDLGHLKLPHASHPHRQW